MATEQVAEILKTQFPDIELAPSSLIEHAGRSTDQLCVHVPPERLVEVLTFLRDDPRLQFEQLCDLFGIDYLNFPKARDRFAVIYSLLSLTHGHRLWVKCLVNDPDPEVPTATGIWRGADWNEREVYDMFGIRFKGHPDLRRILTWEGFGSYPLRKDYPIHGKGERENYEVLTRESS